MKPKPPPSPTIVHSPLADFGKGLDMHDVTITRAPRTAGLPKRVRLLRTLAATALTLVALGGIVATYIRIEHELRRTLESKLVAVLAANVHAAEQWLEDHGKLAQNLAEKPAVASAAANVVDADDQNRAQREAALFAELRPLYDTGLIVGHALHDGDGRLLVASEGAPHLVSSEPSALSSTHRITPLELPRQLLEGIADRGYVVVVPSKNPRDVWRGRVAALAAIGKRREPTALLTLLVDPARLARGLQVASWGKSGETFAFDAGGAFLSEPRFLPPRGDHHEPVVALVAPPERSSAAEAPRLTHMAERATAGFSGVDVSGYLGYLGTPVVGAWQWLDRYGFGIATELRRDEAYESVSLLRSALSGMLVFLGITLLGFILLGRWTLRVREESVRVTAHLSRLARAIQPLSAALENDPSAVVLADGSGNIVYANEASRRVLGTDGPLIGASVDEAFDGLPVELQEALDSGQDSIVARGKDGEDETLLVSSRALTIDGRAHEMYMLRPVTRQVRRQEIEHWRKLIRVLSHELNNSLAPIASLVATAKKVNELSHGDERLARIFDTIVERTQHLVTFLESYRAIARLPLPVPRTVSWSSFVESLRSQAAFRLVGTLPETAGQFDRIQLERAVANVLKNAREAGSPDDDIELRVTEEAEKFRVDVLDRGTGMAEPVLGQAMLPFFSTKEGGTGVGLALCREVVEGHGGDLVLANREGGGLIVSLTLPKTPPQLGRRSLSRIRARPAHEAHGQDPQGGDAQGRDAQGRDAQGRDPHAGDPQGRDVIQVESAPRASIPHEIASRDPD